MTYDQVVTLDYIVNFGSFKAASEAMHKSQPSLSMAIKKMEEQYNVQIFDRSGYRPILTEQGKHLYRKAQNVIKAFQDMELTASQIGMGLEAEISICVDSIFPIFSISHILSHFHQPHISTTLNLNADVLDGVMEKVTSHQVDFALGPRMGSQKELEFEKISHTTIVPVIGKQHHQRVQGNANYLKQLPQIIVSSSIKEKKENIDNVYSDQIWFTSDFSMREQLIEAGLGWGRVPIHHVDDKIKNKNLYLIEGIPHVQIETIPMYLIRSRSKIMGPNTQRLWDYLSELKKTN